MDEKLLAAAWAAREHSYSPYSRFQVGAALELGSGQIFTGCNVEAANYACTICAERTAIAKAVSEGALRPGGLKTVLVATDTPTPTAPCGSCRQSIEEFANQATRILISHKPHEIALCLLHRDLLPYSFNSTDLVTKG